MKLCNFNHSEIIYSSSECPLCNLRKHSNTVHDFIESEGMELVRKLVKYQSEHQEPTNEQ